MIFERLFLFASNIIVGIFSTFEVINLPVDFVSALYNILCYGVWVVGSDVIILCFASVMGWFSFKMSAGVAVWLWKLLPLT